MSVGDIDDWMTPLFVGKGGKEIRRLMDQIGGIGLTVRGGVCRGRAASPRAAVVANRIVAERVRL